jgi:hypothetical protein
MFIIMKWMYSLLVGLLISTLCIAQANAQFQPTGGPFVGGVQLNDMIEWQGSWYAAANDFLVCSNDQGRSWEVVQEGLPEIKIGPRSFAIFDGYLYMSTVLVAGFFRTADGVSWEQINSNLPSVFGIPIYTA